MAPLTVAVVAYPFLPSGQVRDLGYVAIGLVAVVAAFWGLVRQGPDRPPGWLLVLSGYLGWILATTVQMLGVHVLDTDAYSDAADVLSVAAYAVVAIGLLNMFRRRDDPMDRTAVLDVAILATGLGIAAGVFLIAPVGRDGVAHPIADVLVLSVLVLLWTKPEPKTTAFRVLSGSLALVLLGDVLYRYTLADAPFGAPVVVDLLWLAGYVLAAGAAWTWSVQQVTEPVPGEAKLIAHRRRLAVLAVGLLLPVVALLVDGLAAGHLDWPVIAVGSLVMAALVALRLGGLLSQTQDQAVELAGLARADALTRIPNRRTFDFELARACKRARELNAPLTVALIDLDGFRQYNDEHGHPGGDRLLREAADAWSALLQPGQVLARYAGKEFALLCPGLWSADARPVIDSMMAATPGDQTVCVGVATWDPHSMPGDVVVAAERALREAKRSGRGKVHLAPRPTSTALIPRPTMLWQPIVDLATTRPVGVEALSRFPEGDPLSVFEAAASVGSGPTLEALAITYALTNRPEGLWVAVNVSLEALGSIQVQRALAGDLTDVVLEITEQHDTDVEDPAGLLQDYRARGAVIAVDDWGPGFSNVDRLVTLRPDIVKIDVSRMSRLGSENQSATFRLLTSWAGTVGAAICAEGVETEEQWRQLTAFGVQFGQGHFFGRPMPPEELLALPRDAVPARRSL